MTEIRLPEPGANLLVDNTQPGSRGRHYYVVQFVRATAKQIIVKHTRRDEERELRFWKGTMAEVGGENSRPGGLASMTHVVDKLILPSSPDWAKSVTEHNHNLAQSRADRTVRIWKHDRENIDAAEDARDALDNLIAILRREQGAEQ